MASRRVRYESGVFTVLNQFLFRLDISIPKQAAKIAAARDADKPFINVRVEDMQKACLQVVPPAAFSSEPIAPEALEADGWHIVGEGRWGFTLHETPQGMTWLRFRQSDRMVEVCTERGGIILRAVRDMADLRNLVRGMKGSRQ